jgi:phosphoribosylglycinamide formyltransferase-1
MNIGILASHNGSNMQSIVDASKSGALDGKSVVVISNHSGSGALARARTEGIPHYHLSSVNHPNREALDREIAAVLRSHLVDIVVLAGYMKKLGPYTLAAYSGRIINIHPALLPKFGGKGMFGMNVHEAVIASRESESGVSIHIVDDEYDAGPIIAQSRVVVNPEDTPQTLAARILEKEHELLPAVLQRIATGEIEISVKPWRAD